MYHNPYIALMIVRVVLSNILGILGDGCHIVVIQCGNPFCVANQCRQNIISIHQSQTTTCRCLQSYHSINQSLDLWLFSYGFYIKSQHFRTPRWSFSGWSWLSSEPFWASPIGILPPGSPWSVRQRGLPRPEGQLRGLRGAALGLRGRRAACGGQVAGARSERPGGASELPYAFTVWLWWINGGWNIFLVNDFFWEWSNSLIIYWW